MTYDLAALHRKTKVIGGKGGDLRSFLDAIREELENLRRNMSVSEHEQLDAMTSTALPAFKETYTDSLTGFKGICTAISISSSGPAYVLLENDHGERWFPVARIGG